MCQRWTLLTRGQFIRLAHSSRSKQEVTQSMSKRNCQDSTHKGRSFFGHFKDECPYWNAKDIEELGELVARYTKYYNYERRMWDKGPHDASQYETVSSGRRRRLNSRSIRKGRRKVSADEEEAAQRGH